MPARWCKEKPVSLVAQEFGLKKHYPETCVSSSKGVLRWSGTTAPRGFSRKYELELEYKFKGVPSVKVATPNLLELSGGKKVPHLFSQKDQTLCLHFHRVWKPSMLIATTTIPWSVMWVEYFEWWLVSDYWAGDEIDHELIESHE